MSDGIGSDDIVVEEFHNCAYCWVNGGNHKYKSQDCPKSLPFLFSAAYNLTQPVDCCEGFEPIPYYWTWHYEGREDTTSCSTTCSATLVHVLKAPTKCFNVWNWYNICFPDIGIS